MLLGFAWWDGCLLHAASWWGLCVLQRVSLLWEWNFEVCFFFFFFFTFLAILFLCSISLTPLYMFAWSSIPVVVHPHHLKIGLLLETKYRFFPLDFWSCRAIHECPSIALMFQIGNSATYHDVRFLVSESRFFYLYVVKLLCKVSINLCMIRYPLLNKMGGCKESPDTCNSTNCRGYEVDIMHFSIGNSIPGRLYGGNSIDAVGNGDK